MKNIDFTALFDSMCCCVCRHDFDSSAIKIKQEEKNLYVLEIVCPECGKNFGLALLKKEEGFEKKEDDALIFQPCPDPITYDEISDAHKFIENLEKDWTKYIPDNLRNP